MNRRLFWKLCLIITTGVVALFYVLSVVTGRTEEGMSYLDEAHREQLMAWGRHAEALFEKGEDSALDQWLHNLSEREQTWVSVARFAIQPVAGMPVVERYATGYNMGRNVDWKIHLYFQENPTMEVPFVNSSASFLIQLPERMRPGVYWNYMKIAMQIVLPMILLGFVTLGLYRHIMAPLRQLEAATRNFSQGNFNVRVRDLLGARKDELAELAHSFDAMAARIGELIDCQRQLINDLSHELRTPLTRLDIAVAAFSNDDHQHHHVERIARESACIRKLVDDTLALAWLENERPQLPMESLDLVDMLDVLAEDARFEFCDRILLVQQPDTAVIESTNHRAVGQALENVLRNALRFTPRGKQVSVILDWEDHHYCIRIQDEGPGVPGHLLETIFQPFFRINRHCADGFGLGLALARRQLASVNGRITARNLPQGGLEVAVFLPVL